MSKGKTRYKCRRCGNSTMFEVEGTAKVARVVNWADREHGYVPLGEPAVIWERLEARPTRCWVCKSDDLGYAQRLEEEPAENQR